MAALDLGEGGSRNRCPIDNLYIYFVEIISCMNSFQKMTRRPIAAMDDMLYGSGGDNAQSGKLTRFRSVSLRMI